MDGLKEILTRATRERWATGHFNVSEFDQMRAVAEACAELRAPAIIGTSEGERKHLAGKGLEEVAAIRDALRKEFDIPIFLNADHSKSVESAKEAIDAGYDSVHIDLSKLPLEENIRGTKEVVEYGKKISKYRNARGESRFQRDRTIEISVEGEVGYFVTESSKQYKEKIEIPPESLTDPDEARRYVEATGVDRLAAAVGSIHGIAANVPRLDIERIKKIRQALPDSVALVLHGGSGISDEDFVSAIKAGVANIHISTALRVAFLDALKESLKENLDEVAMYKIDESALEAFKKEIKQKLQLFGPASRV